MTRFNKMQLLPMDSLMLSKLREIMDNNMKSLNLNVDSQRVIESIAEKAEEESMFAVSRSEEAKTQSQAAKDKSDSTQTQLDTVIIESGTSDAETLQARTNNRGKSFSNLKNRVDDLDKELAERSVNIKWFYAEDGSTTDGEAMIAASQSNTAVEFPSGTYTIDAFTQISNKENLRWVANGKVTIVDACKTVSMADGSSAQASNGLRFENCSLETEGNFIHDQDASGGGEVSAEDRDKIVPAIDFHNCSFVDFSINPKGTAGPHGTSTNDQQDTAGAHETMRSAYFRFYECDKVDCKGSEMLSGAGGGEYYTFNQITYLKLEDCSHVQGASSNSFWSFAKVINCKYVKIENLRVQSESSGSFMDVSGDYITFENIILDYPNGKLLDITQEWGYNNVNTKSVEVKNCHTNSNRLAFVSKHDNINLKTIDKVVLDNIIRTNAAGDDYNNSFMNPELIKELIIKNTTIKNVSYVNSMIPVEGMDIENQTVLMDNVDILSDKPVQYDSTKIETLGTTTVKNSYINLDNQNVLTLLDRDYPDNVSSSENTINFVETRFEDTTIRIESNVSFESCYFKNVKFSIADDQTHPHLSFDDCTYELNEMEEGVFNFKSLSSLKVLNSEFKGTYTTAGYDFFRISRNVSNDDEIESIEFNNNKFNITRMESGEIHSIGGSLFALSNSGTRIKHLDMINNTLGKNMRYMLSISGESSTKDKMFYRVMHNLMNPNESNNERQLVNNGSMSNDTIQMHLVGNQFLGEGSTNAGLLSDITGDSTFAKLVHANNIEW